MEVKFEKPLIVLSAHALKSFQPSFSTVKVKGISNKNLVPLDNLVLL